MTTRDFPLLDQYPAPGDLRRLSLERLPAYAAELRASLIDIVSQAGGHFAGGLGTIELTVALHHVFDTPRERLVWDIGHQAYPHKMLTGRRARLGSIRKDGGLASFLSRDESEFDAFGAGHSSTSISAALGMAVAAQLEGDDRRTVAIIGDGGITAGMAYEALNHAGDLDANLIVVLNDNAMSISPNVGAIRNYSARLLSGRTYRNLREQGKQVLEHVPPLHEFVKRAETHVKGMVSPAGLFEELGFNYIGPVDGHDVIHLAKTLRNLRHLPGPQFLHVITRKGQGYVPAQADPVAYHAVPPFDPAEGVQPPAQPPRATFSSVFGRWLCDAAAREPRLVGITPAMREGSGMVEFARRFPARYHDVAIAEQHAVTFAAGLAAEGLRPVVAIYSTFLQRGYDQLIHDVAVQGLPVLFAIDRAGLVGGDGATHNGAFDLAFLRCVPGLTVMTPADEHELWQMLELGLRQPGPVAVRYPRGSGPGHEPEPAQPLPQLGRGQRCREGRRVALLAFGPLLDAALEAGAALDATVVNMRFVKPLDEGLLADLAARHELLVTLEEHAIAGGAGSAVLEALAARGLGVPVLQLGLPDRFIGHGTPARLLADLGLDAAGIATAVRQRLGAPRQAQGATG